MPNTDAELRRRRLEDQPLVAVGPQPRFFRGSWASVVDIYQYRELLGLLVRRELRARYKGSSLGFIWSLMKPVVQLVIYFVVLGQFLGMARGIPQFAIFVFSGLTVWSLFNEIAVGGTGSIVGNAGLIKKVYVPREIFPLSVTGSGLFNFGIQFVVLLVATVVAGDIPLWGNILYVPFAVLLVVVFGTAVGILLSACNVYLRDVQHLIEIVMLVLFWASPIVYSFTYVNDVLRGGFLEQLYLSNPITIAVLAFQRGMWTAGADQPFPAHMPERLALALLLSTIFLWLAQRVFARLEGNFAQEL
jgi:ABC-2 type transport system permease protein